jgi:hypothetical protein
MPKGPQGQKRPADVIGNAVHVMRIATGQVEEKTPASEGKEYARKGGLKGGKARAAALSKSRRSEIAKRAAQKRWAKS